MNINFEIVLCLTWGNCCQFGEWFLTDRIFWAPFPKHSQNRCFYHVLIPSTTVDSYIYSPQQVMERHFSQMQKLCCTIIKTFLKSIRHEVSWLERLNQKKMYTYILSWALSFAICVLWSYFIWKRLLCWALRSRLSVTIC